MIVLLLCLVLPLSGTAQSAKPNLDLSGTWHDEKANNEWTLTQNGADITIVNPRGVKLRGKLEGKRIKYTDQTVLTDTTSPVCRPYVGQAFEFPATLKIANRGNRLERKIPDAVTRGRCTIRIGQMRAVILTRSK